VKHHAARRCPEWTALEQWLLPATPPAQFRASQLGGWPDPVRRYFTSAIADEVPLAAAACIRMRGNIKLGTWLPFRAEQVLAPGRGTVWAARVVGLLIGSDQYLEGRGWMEWRLFGVLPVVRANGADISRSTTGRLAAESVWVPTALAGRHGLAARATGDNSIALEPRVDSETITVEHGLDADGRVLWSRLQRWGDPEGRREWRMVPFGLEFSGWRTFDGVAIPHAGRAGWYYGTDRWPQGEFFRYQITHCALVEHV
jgi:hypothetical protein